MHTFGLSHSQHHMKMICVMYQSSYNAYIGTTYVIYHPFSILEMCYNSREVAYNNSHGLLSVLIEAKF
jgi:hypothetical protein